jgi:hypothetical protein
VCVRERRDGKRECAIAQPTLATSANRQKDVACYDCHVNKAATTMWDFDKTTLCYLFCGLSFEAEKHRWREKSI